MKKKVDYEQSLYKDEFYKKLKGTIRDPNKFIKMNDKRRYEVYKKLVEIGIFSSFTNFFKEEKKISLFEDEYQKFKKVYQGEMVYDLVKTKKDSSNLKNQLALSIGFILDYLEESSYIKEGSISKEEVLENINTRTVFYLILSSFISSINTIPTRDDDGFKSKSSMDASKVNRRDVNYSLMDYISVYLVLIAMGEGMDTYNAMIDVYQNFNNIKFKTLKNNLGQCFEKVSMMLIFIFIDILELESNTEKRQSPDGRPTSDTFIKLSKNMDEYSFPLTHIPLIYKPNTNYKGMDSLLIVKRVKNGASFAELGSESLRSLSVSEKKEFRINPEAIKLFKKLDKMNYEQVKHLDLYPFSPMSVLLKLEEEINQLEKNIGKDINSKINETRYKKISERGKLESEKIKEEEIFKKRKKSKRKKTFIPNLDEILSEECNVKISIVEDNKKLKLLKDELRSRTELRKLHNTTIKIADIFTGFPIFFINTLDYRLRMYPFQYMFNRTSGVYKYLLMEPKTRIGVKGGITMLKAYFSHNEKAKEEIKKLENNRQVKINDIIQWGLENINLSEIKESDKTFVYKYLLGIEIINLKSNKYYSGIMTECDQKTSAAVLLSIIFQDIILAKKTSLISSNEDKEGDVNVYLMQESVKFFKGKISDESLEVIRKNRKLSKYLFMCYIYSETGYGRMKRVRQYIKCRNDITTIANSYPQLIDGVFPSINSKKNKFEEIIKYYLDNSVEPIKIETMDGSNVKWNIYEEGWKERSVIKVVNPITKKRVSHRMRIQNLSKRNKTKILNGMLASFIHSIDAAIMKLIILKIYDNSKNKYIVNHVHDSVSFSPSKYELVIESIQEVYTSNVFENSLERYLFNVLRIQLLPEKREGFNELVKELFNNNFQKIELNHQNIDIEKMFPFE